jgi:hypothetical protein
MKPPALAAALVLSAASASAQAASASDVGVAAVEQWETRLHGDCEGEARQITLIASGAAPARLAVERQMQSRGIAVTRNLYRVTGCGRPSRRHNIDIVTAPEQAPIAAALPIGTTAMSSVLLRSVMDSLMTPMMRARYPECAPGDLKIIEANVSDGAPYERGRPWSELWRYDACGQGGIAELRFTYDGEGVRMEANVMPAS